jgi:hypothetical protein
LKYPLGIKELIHLLYHNKDIVEMLFGKKSSVSRSEILSRPDTPEEKLDKLLSYNIVSDNNAVIILDDRIITFFEEFLEIGEVTTSFILDNIEALNENIRYFGFEANVKFLRNIKKALHRINSTTTREVIKLHKNIDETYKNQANYFIKLQELAKYKKKRDDIIDLIRETETILTGSEAFFYETMDYELLNIVPDLRYNLIRNRDYLNEIQAQIIDYINKIQYQSEVYKKLQRLKELKDNEELKYKTNFIEIIKEENALLLHKRTTLKSKIALDFLYSDAGHKLVRRVAAKLQLKDITGKQLAARLEDNAFAAEEEKNVKLNVLTMMDKFHQSQSDLFSFLMNYNYPEELGKFLTERKISLFVELSIDFDKELNISDTFGHYEFMGADDKIHKAVYALIHHKQEKPT